MRHTPRTSLYGSRGAGCIGTLPKVIIAGAGGATHLSGMVASLTTLPVIGVPIKSKNSIVWMGFHTIHITNAIWSTGGHSCLKASTECRSISSSYSVTLSNSELQ